jgi:hypothetical protein
MFSRKFTLQSVPYAILRVEHTQDIERIDDSVKVGGQKNMIIGPGGV